ncbi:S24 family peptidase [Bacillus solimangrovi]|uniref:S24 family peptidase n=1 Tax=Bacillus solimangrovi TaxID=1305675 RepID=UPI003CCB9DB3
MSVNSDLLGYKDGFMLHIENNDMSGDRILEGDSIVVVMQDFVSENDIALLSINNGPCHNKPLRISSCYFRYGLLTKYPIEIFVV